MNAWPFVIAAYALMLGGSGLLVALSWIGLRAAEKRGK